MDMGMGDLGFGVYIHVTNGNGAPKPWVRMYIHDARRIYTSRSLSLYKSNTNTSNCQFGNFPQSFFSIFFLDLLIFLLFC